MKRGMIRFCTGAYLILLTLSTSGCFPLLLGAAAGAGGWAFYKGELTQNYDANVDKLQRASVKALKDLGYFVVMEDVRTNSAVIKAEDGGGRPITVTVEALTERSSKISIRVGTFGDESRSIAILNAVEKRL